MLRIVATLVTLSLFISCTAARKPDTEVTDRGHTVSVEKDWYIVAEVPFDEAWAATISALQAEQWPGETEDRVTLTVTTGYMAIGTNAKAGTCTVSGARFSPFQSSETQLTPTEMRCRLVVHMTPSGEAATKVSALAEVQVKFAIQEARQSGREGSSTEWLDCDSTGEIEREFFDGFLSRIEPIRYDPPVYRRVR